MLAFTVYPKELIVIGDVILFLESKHGSQSFRIAIDAPKSATVIRHDLVLQFIEDNGYEFVGINGKKRLYKRKLDGVILESIEILRLLLRDENDRERLNKWMQRNEN